MAGIIEQHSTSEATPGRFTAVLSNTKQKREPYDQPVAEIDGCVIAPTLGSILPRWVLLLPRVPVPNLVRWRTETGLEPRRVVEKVAAECRVDLARLIWFEHGASGPGSPIACGVDHAHLHLLIDPPFSLDDLLAGAKSKDRSLRWQQCRDSRVYPSVQTRDSYLYLANATDAVLAEGVDGIGSQFLRRVVADLVSTPEAWNYKTHAHLENVRETVQFFEARRARNARP